MNKFWFSNKLEVFVGFKSWIISEITKDLAKELTQWQSSNTDDLPFNDLFNKESFISTQALTTNTWRAEDYPITRTVIPFHTDPEAPSIINKIKQLGLTINYKTGIISKDKKQVRLGKFLLGKKSPFTEEEKYWWVHTGQPLDKLESSQHNNEYAIVISRNPIDIVRMSNHDDWTSCHSPNREYFKCAISDAKGAGAIAYVIKKSDLHKIDLQAPEVFTDAQRGFYGITPTSRIRLRKFVHKTDGYDLAVPEDRVYGKQFSGLEESVRKWALQAQQNKLQGKRPRMRDFLLMGGSYQDTQGSDLFNNLFGDKSDAGDADYGGEDDHQNMMDQMQAEVDLIENEYRNYFKYCGFYASVEESDGHPYVNYSGYVHLKIPEDLNLMSPNTLGDKDAPDYWQKQRKIEKTITQWAKDNYIYGVQSVQINDGEVSLDLHDDDGNLDPDSFRSFLENDLTDIEKKGEELTAKLYHLFVELGFAKKNQVYHITTNWDAHKYKFQNFEWTGEEPAAMVTLKTPILLTTESPQTASGFMNFNTYWQGEFKKQVMQELNNWADRIHSQPSLFPGAISRSFKSEFKIQPEIEIKPDKNPWQKSKTAVPMAMYMTINFEPFTKDEDFHDVIEFIKFLDQNYQRFTAIVNNTYKRLVGQFENQVVKPLV